MNDDRPVSGVLERKLWYETPIERVTVHQADLLTRMEPLVVLGEAGMGKSHLLEWIAASPGHALCTARQLINRYNPHTLLGDAECLVIDALDEVSAGKDGDAVDLILRRLGELGCPRFVLSCRVSDWRSATGTEAILEQYDRRPTELFLEPLTDEDAIAFLSAKLGIERATSVVQHFSSRGLDGLLGNPQTLGLIASIAASDSLPETRAELFRRSTELLRVEHRDSKSAKQLDQATAIDAAGAAFAALILTGNEAITRKSAAHVSDGEIAISEIARFSGKTAIAAMLDTRLFRAYGADRFSYLHRRIGEFLGAQWLAKLADTPRKRRRLLALFHGHGMVPSSLRGTHAWLAQDPALAQAVIGMDPLGVIEYGDADTLPPNHARWLLGALRNLAESNPHFYDWGVPSARGLFQSGLIDDIRQIIVASDTPFSMRLFLAKAAKGVPTASSLSMDLRNLVLDPNAVFAIRSAAAETLTGFLRDPAEWRDIIRKLRDFGDDLSIRLAIELLGEIGYQAADDAVISGLAVSNAIAEERTVGVLFMMERELPADRIEGVLDHFVAAVRDLGEPHSRPADNALNDFAYNLIARRLAVGDVAPNKLWAWLEPFDASSGYQQEARKQLHEILRGNDHLRRSIQRQRILEADDEKDIWRRNLRMCRRSSGFEPSTEDVIELLQLLDPNDHADERWRELVQLVHHDSDLGADVRMAARRFSSHSPDLLIWLDALANPPQPEWKIKQAERERHAQAKLEADRAEQRRLYVAHLQQIRAGDFQWVVDPAQAYLGLFSDLPTDMPAHERIEEWLGSEVAGAAHEGFEAFLMADPPKPTADDIAEGLAKGERWNGGYVIVAALAERIRNGNDLTDLSDERLMAGLFSIRSMTHRARIDGLGKAIESELSMRGKLLDAMRLFSEPQLRERREHIDGIYLLMRDDAYADLGADLAREWLEAFDNLPSRVEEEMIGRLIRSGRAEDLRHIAMQRENLDDADRRRNWDAAGLLVDFERVTRRLASSTIDADLLWHLRDLTVGNKRPRDLSAVKLDPAQIEWIFSTFRSLWPMANHPAGGWSGSRNPWDASEYLIQLLRRLGGDPHENATAALQRIQEGPPDAYTNEIRSIAAEQAMAHVESRYGSTPLRAVEAIIGDLPPETAADLQAVVIEELSIVQAKVRSDDAESWRGFFDDKGLPYNEERCRDHLLGLLRQGTGGIQYDPETHVAGDKEVDITCSAGTVRIPIEVKGQWNPQLWHGADTQLDRLYATDWRSERRGIYLVLWFGDQSQANKKLVGPGQRKPRPQTSDELQDALVAGSLAARDGRTQILVLDLTLDGRMARAKSVASS